VNNFVYASDSNYNNQLYYSIFSLLENFMSQVNIYVIHKDPSSFTKYKNNLLEKFNNLNLNIYKFDFKDIEFPNIQNKHVSEATYYRLFIDQFIPSDLEYYMYLDADIICINNPKFYLNELVNEMKKENFIIGCRTENNKIDDTNMIFENLSMNSSKYFNAGVMIVNHQKWLEKDIGKKLLTKLEEIREEINYWDQDVLNSYFDGTYKEISQNLNFPLNLRWPIDCKDVEQKGIFLHYQSNNKPWSIRGSFNEASKYYQNYSLKINSGYHLEKTVKRYDILYLLLNTFKFKFIYFQKPFNFYKESIKLILK
jgi:lipopolysaccharide biosynthesis glycosyltransferase